MPKLMISIRKEIIIFAVLLIAAYTAFFWLLNGGAYAKELRYRLFLNTFASDDLNNDIISLAEDKDLTLPLGSEFQLIIPKISVVAPLIVPQDSSMPSILASLEEGVGLYPGSVIPGKSGRSVILGHSSRATWYRGGYATVFTLLSKLEKGDSFYMVDKEKKYYYEVFAAHVLTPQETNRLLSRPTNGSEINLITCYPLGSSSKRTVVQAKLVTVENL